jgi:hypothetical protein
MTNQVDNKVQNKNIQPQIGQEFIEQLSRDALIGFQFSNMDSVKKPAATSNNKSRDLPFV